VKNKIEDKINLTTVLATKSNLT